jgi:hypothetical protein
MQEIAQLLKNMQDLDTTLMGIERETKIISDQSKKNILDILVFSHVEYRINRANELIKEISQGLTDYQINRLRQMKDKENDTRRKNH